jgi:hypothetical protein
MAIYYNDLNWRPSEEFEGVSIATLNLGGVEVELNIWFDEEARGFVCDVSTKALDEIAEGRDKEASEAFRKAIELAREVLRLPKDNI